MIIQYASDLHLEFPENREYLRLIPIQPHGDVLILAGDIVPFARMHEHEDFFTDLSDRFPVTWWIPGNHEYYYSDAANRSGAFQEAIRPNVFLVNNIALDYASVRFIFSTLWSRIDPVNQRKVERHVSDFHVIKYNGRRFTAHNFNQLHVDGLDFITRELISVDPVKKVLVSHHVPTLMNYPEKYKGDPINDAFAVELSGLIENQGPDYWIYGHTHQNTPEFEIGKTQLLTNQLGYVKYGEHDLFDNSKVLEFTST